MNGRSYSAASTAVDRTSGPVLAWNVESTQFPAGTYPEMPTAAAAAVSPVVPAAASTAAPPDPYGRCWQNQVDPSACFPYFGPLYGSSLPPPSYRMQPGCITQFWPPTPPPEGCVRYDGANNLHYCPPLFRHSESMPQNMLGVQRLAHYPHLIDMNKDAGLKRLDSCLDSMQRQKVLASTKHSKEPHQRTCSCYECNEKNLPHGTTHHNVNKENINDGSKLLEQKCSEDKIKSKLSCRKSEAYSQIRTSIPYPPHTSVVSSYSCSGDPNITRTSASMQLPNQSEYLPHNSQKVDIPVSSNGCVQHDFIKPEAYPGSRCTINTSLSAVPIKGMMTPQLVHSTLKNEPMRFDTPTEKPRPKLHASTSAYDSCPCPPIQTQSSSIPHRSAENSCCFSPPYMSSRTLYHNYPENSMHNKNPNMLMMYGNGFNASPLKNVYFSYYESENFDTGTGSASRKNRNNCSKIEKVVNGNTFNNHMGTPVNNHLSYSIPTKSQSSLSSSKYLRGNPCESIPVSSDSYRCVYQSACSQQLKGGTSSYHMDPLRQSDLSIHASQISKPAPVCIKQEKIETADCKFQKIYRNNTSTKIPALTNAIVPNGVLNLSTSVRCPKIEPDDQMTGGNVDLTRTFTDLPAASSSDGTGLRCSLAKAVHGSRSLKLEGSNGYFLPPVVPSPLVKCIDVRNATTPQMHELVSDYSPTVPEGLCPLPQSTLGGGAELAIMSKMPTTGYEAPIQVVCQADCSQENISSRQNGTHSNSASHHSMSEEPRMQDHHNFMSLGEEIKDSSQISSRSFTPKESTESNSTQVPESAMYSPCQTATVDTASSKVEPKVEPTICMNKKDEIKTANSSAEEFTERNSRKEERIDLTHEFEKLLSNRIPEKKEVEDYNGLYVLLQGIAKRKTIEESPEVSSKTQEPDDNETKPVDILKEPPPTETVPSASYKKSEMKGLNLLCALAEEQFLIEFGESCKMEMSDEKPTVNLSSNYPSVKEENASDARNLSDEDSKAEIGTVPTTEIHMRQRLAELQQIYKEKQKELARLKSKKSRNSGSSDASSCSGSVFESSERHENQGQIMNCSGDGASPVKEEFDEACSMSNLEQVNSEPSGEVIVKQEKVMENIIDEVIPKDEPVAPELLVQVTEATDHEDSSAKKVLRKHMKILKRLDRQSLQRRRRLVHTSSSRRSQSSRKRSTRNGSMKELIQAQSDLNEETKTALRKHKKKLKHGHFALKMEAVDPVTVDDKPVEDMDFPLAQSSAHSERSPKKRKAENPKKFMPAKQVRLTETLVTKQLRNRILFEAPDCYPEKSQEKPYDVPETLFDALRKCKLDESNHNGEEASDIEQVQPPVMPQLEASIEPELTNQDEAQKCLNMTVDNMKENQRILAIEDGLFYAGSIKELQSNDVCSVVLDGQRGNKKHLFSKEEMMTQTILESKPVSLNELPEGTRVCAFWSHQYRCLYPGTVVRAPAPSVDWSEPRVFVEFDDGDSAQIALKNIRFLPHNLKLSDDEEMKESLSRIAPLNSKRSSYEGKNKRKATKEREKDTDILAEDFSPNKKVHYCSKDDNGIECCESQRSPCPSQKPFENESLKNCFDSKESKRFQRQQLKQRSTSKNKTRVGGSTPEKSKKHKKYKDRHKHHHHHRHHHRHHRHCHHHRHCKKRKHHKRTSNVDNIINVVIPSNSIPFSSLIAKSTRSSAKDVEDQCIGHSRKDTKQLPQPNGVVGDSKLTRDKGASKKAFPLR